MMTSPSFKVERKLTRRRFMHWGAAVLALAASWTEGLSSRRAAAQAQPAGWPPPDEPVESTLKRLFGKRSLLSGDGKIKLELPVIAEEGGNVAITMDANLPVTGATPAGTWSTSLR